MKRFVLLGGITLLWACGSEDRPPVAPSGGSTGGRSSTGSGGNGGDRDGGREGGSDPDAPRVNIVSPPGVSDPNDDGVIVPMDENEQTSEVAVVCRVEGRADAGVSSIDEGSIRIERIDEAGMVVDAPVTSPTDSEREYGATFSLREVPSGRVYFRCSASDQSQRSSTDEIQTYVDHGPIVGIDVPADRGAFPLEGVHNFEFSVAPAPVDDDDDGSVITGVSLTVGASTFTREVESDGAYSVSLDFQDVSDFPVPPNGEVRMSVRGINARNVERVVTRDFFVDNDGPVITMLGPPQSTVIPNQTTIRFSIVDAISGVIDSTIVVTINGVAYRYDPSGPWGKEANGVYTFRFDSESEGVGASTAQLTVNVRATDLAGNESQGDSLLLNLDTQPPIVELDPLNVREWRIEGPNTVCSTSFDPLGAAADDGSTQYAAVRLRALVWDMTNVAVGPGVLYYAGTNPEGVYLYLQPNPNNALLVDGDDADDVCDEIATVDPEAGELPFLRMDALAPTGSAFYSSSGATDEPLPANGSCILGTATTPPAPLCSNASDLRRVIRHGVESSPPTPVVYVVAPGAGPACTGITWEISQFVPQSGWICLAARATDNVGNVGVSPPLRVCFDADGPGGTTPECAVSMDDIPSCTDGCTPPPRLPNRFVKQ